MSPETSDRLINATALLNNRPETDTQWTPDRLGERLINAGLDALVAKLLAAGAAMPQWAETPSAQKKAPGRSRGGHVRAAVLSSERRQEIARKAALARWRGTSQTPGKPDA